MNAKDDVGQMLFEASAGLGAFGDFRDKLNSEAKNLWTKRKSDSLYYKALADFNEAKRSLKGFTVRAKDWKRKNENIGEADDAWNSAKMKWRHLEDERNRLERIRRVAPHLHALQTKLQGKASLGEVVILPESASEELSRAEKNLVKIENSLEKCQAFIDNITEEKNAIVIDETILIHEKQIIDLEEQRLKVKDHPRDMIKREAEAKIIRDAIENTIQQLGWIDVAVENLKSHIPSQIVQAEINDLLQKHGRLEEALSNRINAVKEQETDCDDLQEKISKIPDNVSPEQLQAVLADTQSLGNTEEKKAEIHPIISDASQRLDNEIKNNLTPWSGTMEELQETIIPDEESVRNLQNHEQDILNKISTNHGEIEDANKK